MKRMSNMVGFKSVPDMWVVEQSGAKANTIREVSLEEGKWLASEMPKEILIKNTETNEVFVRTISNILRLPWLKGGDGGVVVLISWRHPYRPINVDRVYKKQAE